MPKGKGCRFGTAVLSLLAFAMIVALAPVRAAAEGMGEEKFKVGDVAPEFEKAAFLDGAEAKLASIAGKRVLLLNFWGLRCGACLEEMPYLEDIAKRYAGKDLAVWGVNTDGVGVKEIHETLQEVNVSVTYPLITDPEFMVTDTYTNFLVPLTLVIDRGGVVRYIHTGFEKGTEKAYEDAVKRALGG